MDPGEQIYPESMAGDGFKKIFAKRVDKFP